MGLISDLINYRTGATVKPADTATNWPAFFGTPESWAGPEVTPDGALQSSAVYACVRVISDAIASLPLIVYQRQPGRGKLRAPDQPLYSLLHDAPNPEQTAFEFRQLLFGHVLTWGNAYAEIEYSPAGTPIALWPIRPDRVTVRRVAGRIVYDVTVTGSGTVRLPRERVHHMRALSSDGLIGLSPIGLAMQSIGLALATEEFGARFFSNGARPGLLLKHPETLSEDAHRNLLKSFAEDSQGLSNAHRVRIIEEGMDVVTVGIPPNEAQFLETRRFQVGEIARIFRVPPHMIGDLDRATFSNIEQQSLDFLQHTLRPWLVAHEQALTRDLMPPSQRGRLLIEYLIDALLRADTQTRFAAYQTAISYGFMSPNEARDKENLNPYAGGDTYYLPVNVGAVDSDGQIVSSAATPAPIQSEPPAGAQARDACDCGSEHRAEPGAPLPAIETRAAQIAGRRRAMARSFQEPLQEAAGRVVKRERQDVLRELHRAAKGGEIGPFLEWLRAYYPELASYTVGAMAPILRTLATAIAGNVADELDQPDPGLSDALRAFVDAYAAEYAANYGQSSLNQIRALFDQSLADQSDPWPIVEGRINEWGEKRAGKEAVQTSFNAANAFALATYGAFGVAMLRYHARGDACPICRKLDGRRVRTGAAFIEPGETIHGGEGQEPLRVDRAKKHPPLHRACDCMIMADR